MISTEMSIERFFLILRTNAGLISSVFLAAIVIASVTTYLTPDMYVARSSLNFDFKSANPMASKGGSLESQDYLYTQIEIINSQNVAQKIEESLTEYERERFVASIHAENTVFDRVKRSLIGVIKRIFTTDNKAPDHQRDTDAGESINVSSAYSWFAQLLGRNLTVEPRINSRIVDISYSSTDPRVAALMANQFAEAYIATNLEMTIDPARKTSLWFDEQLKALRIKLEDAQAALTAYQQKEGIVSSDERLDTESARLRELSSQLVTAQQDTRNAVFAQKKLKEIQAKGVPLTSFSLVFENSEVKKIKSEIRRLQGELVDISATLGKNHPRYKRVSSELYAARGRLQTEITVITDGINNTAELTKAREIDLSEALEAQKQMVLDLKREHDKISVLERELESANETYNAALSQMNTTSMQSMLNQTNVFIVDPANIPGEPSSPLLTLYLAVGAFGGLLLGIGLAILKESLTRRIHSKEDLLLELKVPLLGHLTKA